MKREPAKITNIDEMIRQVEMKAKAIQNQTVKIESDPDEFRSFIGEKFLVKRR